RQAAAELEIEQSYTSLEAMLACKDLEAVVIATPDKFHAQAVRVAAAAGKDILCEKPLATNLSDAHAALNAVAKAGVRLQIGFMRRYDPRDSSGSCAVRRRGCQRREPQVRARCDRQRRVIRAGTLRV